ncbi:MAG: extracellular solute-binding protein [Candidatus Colwellbacteria bacterium]|nr:extracellular solute-binding protein [Candidatus Colwellbacteria bacterium]
MTKNQKIIIAIAIGVVFLFSLLLIVGRRPPQSSVAQLSFWGLEQETPAWNALIGAYSTLHPRTRITYTGFDEDVYEKTLLDNMAAGTGPDVFIFRNDWFTKHKNKIVSAPADLISPATVTEKFPAVVSSDFVDGGAVWGLPLSIDTLALIYNVGLFDASGVASPQSNWDEVQRWIPRLRRIEGGILTRASVSLGGSEKSVANSADILRLLMLQHGARLTDLDYQRATFNSSSGLEASEFYMKFSNKQNISYAWEESFDNSLKSFADGKTAAVFAYFSQIPQIKAMNPGVRIGILPAPQFDIDQPVNYAKYWALTASNATKSRGTAWDFITFAALNSGPAGEYLKIAGNPPALRELIARYQTNPTLKVFALQSLSAQSWRNPDHTEVARAWDKMLLSFLSDRASIQRALSLAAEEVTKLITSRPR